MRETTGKIDGSRKNSTLGIIYVFEEKICTLEFVLRLVSDSSY